VDAFIHHITRSSEYSPSAVKAYRIDLTQFVAFLADTAPGIAVAEITPRVVQAYAEHIADLRPTTVGRKLSALKTLFDWLWLRGDVASNPVQALKRPRNWAKETRWVTAEDGVHCSRTAGMIGSAPYSPPNSARHCDTPNLSASNSQTSISSGMNSAWQARTAPGAPFPCSPICART